MPTIPNIWLCAHCTSSFDAGPPAEQRAFAGCPRCRSPRIQWCIPAAYHLAAGGSLAGAFAILELDQQKFTAYFCRHHAGDACLLTLTLNLAPDEKPALTRRAALLRRLRLRTKNLASCVN